MTFVTLGDLFTGNAGSGRDFDEWGDNNGSTANKETSLMTWLRTTAPRACVRAIFLLVSVFALAGCGHKDTLVGKWQGTTTTQQGSAMNTTFEFMPDGKENLGIQGSMGAMTIAMS